MKYIVVFLVLVAFTLSIVDAGKNKEQTGGSTPDQAKDRVQKGKSQGPSITEILGNIAFAGIRFVREAPDQAKENREKSPSHAPAQAQENIGRGKYKQSQ